MRQRATSRVDRGATRGATTQRCQFCQALPGRAPLDRTWDALLGSRPGDMVFQRYLAKPKNALKNRLAIWTRWRTIDAVVVDRARGVRDADGIFCKRDLFWQQPYSQLKNRDAVPQSKATQSNPMRCGESPARRSFCSLAFSAATQCVGSIANPTRVNACILRTTPVTSTPSCCGRRCRPRYAI